MKRKSLPTGRDFLFVEGYGNENPGAFQSTRPLRGATSDHPWRNLWAWVFQPTRPLRGATGVRRVCIRTTLISTHAPLAGRDRVLVSLVPITSNFNPRAPCGARQTAAATRAAGTINFNPRAPCGARPWCQNIAGENDKFQPTRPLRGATARGPLERQIYCYFNPRAPCGARLKAACAFITFGLFQPTRPLRGATSSYISIRDGTGISTHAPLAGRDIIAAVLGETYHISTHAPLAGRDPQ